MDRKTVSEKLSGEYPFHPKLIIWLTEVVADLPTSPNMDNVYRIAKGLLEISLGSNLAVSDLFENYKLLHYKSLNQKL